MKHTNLLAFSKKLLGPKPSIAIVGAGVAGLRCADVLLERGYDVTLIEARNRVGGRVYSVERRGALFDIGANWIHGTKDNPILDLARATGTVALDIGESMGIYSENGRRLDPAKATELSEILWSTIADAFEYSHRESESDKNSIPSDRSLKDFVLEKIEKTELSSEDRRGLLQMGEMWGAFIGSPWERQSLKYFWLEACLEGSNLFVASSYKAILDRIAHPAKEKARIFYDTCVNAISIDYRENTQHVRLAMLNLQTTKPFEEVFDAAVVTVPLGCLKTEQLTFHPPLPARITRAVKNIGYGSLEKVYLVFDRAFWSSKGSEPFFYQFLNGREPQNVDCVSFSDFDARVRRPVLLFYIHGLFGQKVTNALNELDRDRAFKVLIRLFKPYFSLLPNFREGTECYPQDFVATNWQNDRWAGYGSYSNYQVGPPDAELDKDIEAIRAGMSDRWIWFAGEHTAPFLALGTTTGAFMSGESTAQRMIKQFEEFEEDQVVPSPVETTAVQVGKGGLGSPNPKVNVDVDNTFRK